MAADFGGERGEGVTLEELEKPWSHPMSEVERYQVSEGLLRTITAQKEEIERLRVEIGSQHTLRLVAEQDLAAAQTITNQYARRAEKAEAEFAERKDDIRYAIQLHAEETNKLRARNDVLDERIGYYRSEWDSACEREQYALARVAEVEKERDEQREIAERKRRQAEAADDRQVELAESRAEIVAQRNAYFVQMKRYRDALEKIGQTGEGLANKYARAALAGGEGEA